MRDKARNFTVERWRLPAWPWGTLALFAAVGLAVGLLVGFGVGLMVGAKIFLST